jgi:hypothetical protein
MRHATSWRKNQSGDDAFGRPLETSSTTTTADTVLPFLYFSSTTTTKDYIHIKFETKFHYQPQIKFIIIIICQKNFRHHHVYYCLFIYFFIFIYYSFFNMQHLSNDTNTWNLIVAPPPASLLYNPNQFNAIAHSSATINELNNPILPISSLITPQTVTIESPSLNYWAFVLIVFPLFTIFGNVLVVVSVYREKSLHTVTNYFVVSLAISDITVAAVVMPFAIYLEVSRKKKKLETND